METPGLNLAEGAKTAALAAVVMGLVGRFPSLSGHDRTDRDKLGIGDGTIQTEC
jgi:hypothetical protein